MAKNETGKLLKTIKIIDGRIYNAFCLITDVNCLGLGKGGVQTRIIAGRLDCIHRIWRQKIKQVK